LSHREAVVGGPRGPRAAVLTMSLLAMPALAQTPPIYQEPPPPQGSFTDPGPSPPTAAPPAAGPTTPAAPKVMDPFPRVRIAGRYTRRLTTFRRFSVSAPRGSRVVVRCSGSRCPYRRRRYGAGFRRITKLQRGFTPGSVIEVRVTAPQVIGLYVRISVRRAQPPARQDRCLVPGNSAPVPCE